jgi:hypothetical protein
MQSIIETRNLFLWKYVDLDAYVNDVESLKKLFLDNLPATTDFFTPLTLGITKFLGMEVDHTVLIVVNPFVKKHIHIDHRDYKLALNIPLKNCDNTVTEMWDCGSNKPTYALTKNNVPYNNYDINQCKKITEFFLTKPIIFNTKIPHSVTNFSHQPRLAISIRFKSDPWELVGL